MLVQILASSACTGVVCTISVPNTSNSSAALAPDPSPTPPTMQGRVAISSRKWFSAIRSGTCATNRSSPTRNPRRCSMYPATHSVVPGATVERRISEWASRSTGSRSSTTRRICDMSISMCTCDGVPSVRTMWSARPASCTARVRSNRPAARTRSSTSCVPVSRNGICPEATCSSTAGSRSTPITSSPRSANDRASGNPTRPRPTTATLVMWRSLRASPLGEVLPGERRQEAGVRVEVARQQSLGLLPDPVDPLEPAVLHPARCHRDAAGVEVERRAHAAHHRHLEAVAHAGHPYLLLRHADPDPQHVRARLVDLRDDGVLLLIGERTERRRVAADDLDARVALAHGEGELHERPLIAAPVEPDPAPAFRAAIAVAEHQLGAVNAVAQLLAQQVRRPHERHAVRHHEGRAAQRLEHLVVAPRLDQRVDRSGADIARLAALHQPVHDLDRSVVVDHRDRHTQQVARLHTRGGGRCQARLRLGDGLHLPVGGLWHSAAPGAPVVERSRRGGPVRSQPVSPAGVAPSNAGAPGPGEARLLASGALVQGIAQAGGLLVLLVIVTVLARRLTVAELGAYGLVVSLAGYLLVLRNT